MTTATDSGLESRRMRTVVWIVALATVGLIFDHSLSKSISPWAIAWRSAE